MPRRPLLLGGEGEMSELQQERIAAALDVLSRMVSAHDISDWDFQDEMEGIKALALKWSLEAAVALYRA
jgi:hypothetical protein